jgi:hypothetical protein
MKAILVRPQNRRNHIGIVDSHADYESGGQSIPNTDRNQHGGEASYGSNIASIAGEGQKGSPPTYDRCAKYSHEREHRNEVMTKNVPAGQDTQSTGEQQ